MSSLACIALVVYMEARSLPEQAQKLVAQIVINRATKDKITICEELKRPKTYSFYWDGKPEIIEEMDSLIKVVELSKEVLKKNENPTYKPINYTHFNSCRLKKRYKTLISLKKIENMCFY